MPVGAGAEDWLALHVQQVMGSQDGSHVGTFSAEVVDDFFLSCHRLEGQIVRLVANRRKWGFGLLRFSNRLDGGG